MKLLFADSKHFSLKKFIYQKSGPNKIDESYAEYVFEKATENNVNELNSDSYRKEARSVITSLNTIMDQNGFTEEERNKAETEMNTFIEDAAIKTRYKQTTNRIAAMGNIIAKALLELPTEIVETKKVLEKANKEYEIQQNRISKYKSNIEATIATADLSNVPRSGSWRVITKETAKALGITIGKEYNAMREFGSALQQYTNENGGTVTEDGMFGKNSIAALAPSIENSEKYKNIAQTLESKKDVLKTLDLTSSWRTNNVLIAKTLGENINNANQTIGLGKAIQKTINATDDDGKIGNNGKRDLNKYLNA